MLAQKPKFTDSSPFTTWEPRVVEIAIDDPEPPILDSASANGKLLDEDIQPLECSDIAGSMPRPEIVRLEHPLFPNSALHFYPEVDFIWLSENVTPLAMTDLQRHYGSQLNNIQNIIVEEDVWDSDDILEILSGLQNIRLIRVWLESYRFHPGSKPRTREHYMKRATKLQERDQSILEGRVDSLVVYVDSDDNIYGGFRVTA
ncbi:uncharacterized protein F5Z01DRAFT_638189 [Emericellopsis atlantica]|uniref:Uncharacterized protein n=1 Tax=Emericellopsis atlantica TaxID=2614577 RepID=A0A9P8CMG4_9HYPO|nr:uncharacterized protein F5Z01DRAFT_638189 [Emericellopsis atlantica]KAG9252689.1 hypothetical protein F5Z01DRAFT_638189 [Emericellopsis atlantica]